LTHLDNDFSRAEALLHTMLAKRDQWLRHVQDQPAGQLRAQLERVLAHLARAALGEAHEALPGWARQALPPLASFAALQLRDTDHLPALQSLLEVQQIPAPEPGHLAAWQGLAELLLTTQYSWRKRLDKNSGFPAPSSGRDEDEQALFGEMKTDLAQLLGNLAPEERLRAALQDLAELPPLAYPDAQWELLEALLTLLPLAVAELQRAFAAAGKVDFIHVALAASHALHQAGAAQGSSSLDYGIRHLLVDEFQDTSFSQFQLLERLTSGWSHDGGQTLFLVGDPMQSIYRFREADVGLYLRARAQGVGKITLSALTLEMNFRSQAGVVAWIDTAFRCVFPGEEHPVSGAVPYSPSKAARPAAASPAVQFHPRLERNSEQEARQVVTLVRAAQAERPAGEVAVLVRSRSHLSAILPAFREAGLAYRAIDIDPLQARPAVQDLLALTRALCHPADRVAWLAVLRAPWCGLLLADLEALAASGQPCTLWEVIDDPALQQGLSGEGAARVAHLREVLGGALRERARRPLRLLVEGAWLAMGGAAGLSDGELADAEAYLTLLEQMEERGEPPDPARLEKGVATLFAPPDPHALPQLQVMTIHRAKGLEFDTVILPGLGIKPRTDVSPLLLWTELAAGQGEGEQLLLAPINETGESQDPIFAYLTRLNRARATHETGRLLYVAVTRAREQVHLLGHAAPNADGEAMPEAGSLLRKMWEVAAPEFAALSKGQDAPVAAGSPSLRPAAASGASPSGEELPNLRRLPANWRLPAAPQDAPGHQGAPSASRDAAHPASAPEFLWAGDTARHVGTVVHGMLQQIAAEANPGAAGHPPAQPERIRGALARLGVPVTDLEQATEKALLAVQRTLADPRGRWLLQAHTDAASELSLTGIISGRPLHVQIDRTLVDEHGVRWIVDYKTGSHQGGDLAGFLDSEQERYRGQLENYARIMRKYDPGHPIRVGLYFPLLQEFRDWIPPEDDQG
ncbi:MAG: UvrD-helicase domain-containing protein, partial [SAR324 cluster bacterium]|nr:UvrD-helicase domain-containing protein [SAR324 cluster bacterium]